MNNKKIRKLIPGYWALLLAVILLFPYEQLTAQIRPGKGKGASLGGGSGNLNPGARAKEVNKPKLSGLGDRQNNAGAVRQNNGGLGKLNGGGDNNIRNSVNKTNTIGSNNNRLNIDNSRKNVNINVDNSKNIRFNNSRNTLVRRNLRPYPRPPFRYGGRRYMCYRPFVFHPFRPFIWGPMWHPWGFFVATLATTAIILSVDNDMPGELDMAAAYPMDNSNNLFQSQPLPSGAVYASYNVNQPSVNQPPTFGLSTINQDFYIDYNQSTKIVSADVATEYYYDQGVFYVKADGGYSVVSAPVGATIKTLPTGYETVSLDDNVTNYYYGGAFYEKSSSGYKVVPATSGALVLHVSDGGEEVKMGEITYVKLGETYYQPVKENGKDMYEVANVEEDK